MQNENKVFEAFLWHELKRMFPRTEDRRRILKAFQNAKEVASFAEKQKKEGKK